MLSVEWFWKLSSIFSWEKESGTARRPGRCYNRFFVAHALPSRLLAVRTTMTHAERHREKHQLIVKLHVTSYNACSTVTWCCIDVPTDTHSKITVVARWGRERGPKYAFLCQNRTNNRSGSAQFQFHLFSSNDQPSVGRLSDDQPKHKGLRGPTTKSICGSYYQIIMWMQQVKACVRCLGSNRFR